MTIASISAIPIDSAYCRAVDFCRRSFGLVIGCSSKRRAINSPYRPDGVHRKVLARLWSTG